MTLPELAKQLGISTTNLRKRAAAADIRTCDDRGRYIELPEDAAERLKHTPSVIAAQRRAQGSQDVLDPCRVPDAPGLPLDALGDPMFRDAFTRMRFEREHRLMTLVGKWLCGAVT